MRTIWTVIIVIALIGSYSSVHADDSIARVGVGGITFLKSTDIRMVKESLKISPSNVYVKYHFLNESNKDILTTVAFPLPAYEFDSNTSESYESKIPLMSFSIMIDGNEVETTKTRRALLIKHIVEKEGKHIIVKEIIDRDITKELKAAGLSDAQIFESFGDSDYDQKAGIVRNRLNKKQIVKLKKIGALDSDNFPSWEVAATVHWKQLFPAKKEIEVEHTYTPFVGGSYTYINNGQPSFEYLGNSDEVCLTKETRKEINQKAQKLIGTSKSDIEGVQISLDEVEFILSTGRNWKGPIGEFTLSIEKNFPDQIVSTCFPGKPKIVNQTTIEYSQTNYITQDKLVVYFYSIGRRN